MSRVMLPRLLVRAEREELLIEMDKMAERRAVEFSESSAARFS